ncbi:MAG: insulinase family protein [Planctomycetaceae bacterium]|nr:insulinase family protein [Planctomycetaceae bacterium]
MSKKILIALTSLGLALAAVGCSKASKTPSTQPGAAPVTIEPLTVPAEPPATTAPAAVAQALQPVASLPPSSQPGKAVPPAASQPGKAVSQASTQPGDDAAAPVTVVEQIDAGKGTTVARLSNGLTVIIKPFNAAPVVCVKAYVHTGGMYEGKWLGSGLSHLTEHLVAEDATHDGATPKNQGERAQPANRVTAIGGQSNASTSIDWTQYYIEASATRANDCIDLVADWMARPNIGQVEFDREHGVVQRELEMGLDEPSRQLYQAHMAAAYRDHPAAVPVIGYKPPLQKLTIDDVRAYIHQMYVPQNMVFCVVGDVDAAAALARVCRAFAGFREGLMPSHDLPDVEPIAGVRRSLLTNKDLKQTMEMLSFQSIPLLHEDLYALDVLSYVLTEGPSSRLVRLLRETQKVTSISSSSWTPAWGKGEFIFSLRCDKAKADAAEEALLAELKNVIAKGVTADEVARAKRQKIADYVFSQQTASSIADTLATDFMTTGDVAFSRSYTDRIQSVTPEQVQQAARKYFTPDQMVITRIEPQAPRSVPAAAAPAIAPSNGRSKPEVFKLPNGTDVVLQKVDVGLVSMTYVTYGGLLVETDATNGLGAVMTELSTRGAGKRSAEEISRFFDAAGGSVSGNCGSNTLYWQASVLDDSFAQALDIFSDVILRPTFPASELDVVRPLALDAIRRQDEDNQSQLSKYWRSKFFAGGPYSRTTAGRESVVEKATVDDIRRYHQQHVLGSAGVLAIYGNFDVAKTRKAIEALFETAKPQAATSQPASTQRTVNPAGEQFVMKTTNEVAGVIVAVPGMTMFNEDRFAITVLDTIISGYELPSGWLHNELRGKRLVYAVHATNWAGIEPGAFLVEATCLGEKVPEVVDIIRANLAKATKYEFTQGQVDEAVNVILTATMLDNQSMSELSMDAALNQLYGFGYDYRTKLEGLYRKVTPADVKRVAVKYLQRPQVIVVTTPKPQVLKWTGAVVEDPGASGEKGK